MGKTVIIETAEEMCALMCDNKLPKRRPGKKNWYFTFGQGQQFSGHYVIIYGTYEQARTTMFEMFGTEWGFQYSEAAWKRTKHTETELTYSELLEAKYGKDET